MTVDRRAPRLSADLQDRLDAFVERLTHDEEGRPRHEAERTALIDAARSLLDRLASGEPAPQAPAPSAPGSLEPGQILANTYTVLEMVGRGGVCEVYHVQHRELRSERAIKIVRPEYAVDPLVKDMMADEARALLNLFYPGVVRCRDLMRHGDGRPFIVMNFVRGPTLAECIEEGPFHLDAVLALARRLAATLATIHAAGYVHQDISPENIILPDGDPQAAVLVDFGIAIDLRSSQAMNRAVSFAGKLSFASPEQMTGAPVTEASDLYSLGLVIAAAVGGARVNMGWDDISARAARTAPPCLPDAPAPLLLILQNLLQPDPRARLAATSLAELLARYHALRSTAKSSP
jgi:serine/threonine protein kinase